MRIYSDVLTENDIQDAAHRGMSERQQGTTIGLYVDSTPIQKPRVRSRGWRLNVSGNGPRWKNSGKHGASHLRAATWDQYGRWFARIFNADPRAVIVAAGRYDGAEDFHEKTRGRFA